MGRALVRLDQDTRCHRFQPPSQARRREAVRGAHHDVARRRISARAVRPRVLAAIVGVALLAVAALAVPLAVRLANDARDESTARLERAAAAATQHIPASLPGPADLRLPDLAYDGDL